jgi:hypothetical protein
LHSPARNAFAEGSIIPQEKLQQTAKTRWNLSTTQATTEISSAWHTGGDLLEARQGVTPGDLEVFLLDDSVAKHLKLESALTHRAIKSKDLERWSVRWHSRRLLYPYHKKEKGYVPAFTIEMEDVKDKKLAKHLTQIGLEDALDFDIQIDDWEREIVRKSGVKQESVITLLQHRIALGLVHYPNAARYLIGHYERLFNRVFEKKRFTEGGKNWYEYHRAREQKIVLAKEKILSPTLIRIARFALDTNGYLSDHACLFLQPTSKTFDAWSAFSAQMKKCLGREVNRTELLTYCLCFLNSTVATKALTEGRQPTPKGSYQITEQSLREVPIAPPSDKKAVLKMLRAANLIIEADDTFAADRLIELEKEIDGIVLGLLKRSS